MKHYKALPSPYPVSLMAITVIPPTNWVCIITLIDAWSTVKVAIYQYCFDYQSKILSVIFLESLHLSLKKRKKNIWFELCCKVSLLQQTVYSIINQGGGIGF